MKTSIITFAVYTLIFLVIGMAVYFFAFWRPHRNRVDQLNQDIYIARAELVTASQRDDMSPELQQDIERLHYELAQVQRELEYVNRDWQYDHLRFLPEVFNELEMRERIYRITTSNSYNLSVYFLYSQPLGVMNYNDYSPNGLPEGIWVTPVNVSFSSDYDGLMAILNGFAHEGLDNRIVDYTIQRQGDQWSIFMRLDILTRTPQPYRYSSYYNVEPHG